MFCRVLLEGGAVRLCLYKSESVCEMCHGLMKHHVRGNNKKRRVGR